MHQGVDVSLIGYKKERLEEVAQEVAQELNGEVQGVIRVGEQTPQAKQ